MPRELNEAEKLYQEILLGIGYGEPEEEGGAPVDGEAFQEFTASNPVGKAFRWGARGDHPVVFRVGEQVPLKDCGHLSVFALFHDETEVRVYAMPTAEVVDSKGRKKVPNPCRFTLTKSSPAAFEEEMLLEVFKDEIRSELDAGYVPEDEEDEDDEEEEEESGVGGKVVAAAEALAKEADEAGEDAPPM